MGVSYEKRLAKKIPKAKHGLWFEFCDAYGRGFCSPDLVLERTNAIIVIEAKLSNYPEAIAQLSGLYVPILSRVYGKPVLPLVALKYLNPNSPLDRVFGTLREAINCKHEYPILHWIGRGPL